MGEGRCWTIGDTESIDRGSAGRRARITHRDDARLFKLVGPKEATFAGLPCIEQRVVVLEVAVAISRVRDRDAASALGRRRCDRGGGCVRPELGIERGPQSDSDRFLPRGCRNARRSADLVGPGVMVTCDEHRLRKGPLPNLRRGSEFAAADAAVAAVNGVGVLERAVTGMCGHPRQRKRRRAPRSPLMPKIGRHGHRNGHHHHCHNAHGRQW